MISFGIQKLIHNVSFWIQKLLLWISFWTQKLRKKHQFLDPETDVFCQFLFWIQKLTLWISFWVHKLTLWARGTLWICTNWQTDRVRHSARYLWLPLLKSDPCTPNITHFSQALLLKQDLTVCRCYVFLCFYVCEIISRSLSDNILRSHTR